MDDLSVIFREKIARGVTAIHPHRWLKREAHSSGFMDYYRGSRRDNPSPSAPPLCIDGIEIPEVKGARAALRKCGRQSRLGVYLAHSLVSRCYEADVPAGVEVQNALEDHLKETFPALKFEVHTPVGKIDCVTEDAIYEVAKFKTWKQALGQLCAYKLHLTRRNVILYLYGPAEKPRALERATLACNYYGIVIDYKRCSI
jgi:hypothetical protein